MRQLREILTFIILVADIGYLPVLFGTGHRDLGAFAKLSGSL